MKKRILLICVGMLSVVSLSVLAYNYDVVLVDKSNNIEELTFPGTGPIPSGYSQGLSPDEAIIQLGVWLDVRSGSASYDPTAQPYGFMFRTQDVQNMINRINDYNSSNPSDTLIGIRIYHVMNPNGNLDNMLLTPVKNNRTNLVPIDPELESPVSGSSISDYILGNAYSCPTDCN